MMSLMYPQNGKSVGVKSALLGGQLIGLALPILLPGNCFSKEVRSVTQKWAGKAFCWKVKPTGSATK
jgi:hypothetical protein